MSPQRPEFVSGEERRTRAYKRVYRVLGSPGTCVLQRVETQIRFLRDETCVVEYRGNYWEYFLLADASEERLDVHDFDMRRDGWGPSDVKRLLRKHRLQDPRGTARLEVTKTFALGLGEVTQPVPRFQTPGGGAFGFLQEVGGVPSSASVVLRDGREVPQSDACPFGATPAGQGAWDGAVWTAREVFKHRLATQTSRLESTDYQGIESA